MAATLIGFALFVYLTIALLHKQDVTFAKHSQTFFERAKKLLSYFNLPSHNKKALSNVDVELLDRHQVVSRYDESTWQRQGFAAFVHQLEDKSRPFPCIYGTQGCKANQLDFAFLPSEELGDMKVAKAAGKVIVEYHKHMHSRGRNTALVMISPPPRKERSLDEYNVVFWSLLRGLRRVDPRPWPKDVPRDTASERWSFNFDGKASFLVVLTPAHRQRKSRYAPNLCITYQPKFIFDALFTSDAKRQCATQKVRGLVDRFDDVPHSPGIADFGVPGTTESKQYFLMDQNKSTQCLYQSLGGH
ncbi:MAG: hypothetical protein M1822_002421 [Bathelium mastoideum]|nr:MAG: hypothetical protein M1822_002421 [Bathelium mastoideum]